MLVALHARGVKLKYLLLADVLLRVDCWTGKTLVCAYVPNTELLPKAGRFPLSNSSVQTILSSRSRTSP